MGATRVPTQAPTQMSKLDKFRDWLLTESHVPVGLAIFAVTSGYHFISGKDLGSNYANSLYALYAFLAGHGLVQAKYNTQGGNPPGQ